MPRAELDPFSLQDLAHELDRLPKASHLFVAFSGGLDSSVLLHALAYLKVPVTAVHIDHGLHVEAPAWSEFCRRQCQSLKIPFVLRRLDLKAMPGQSLEAVAREARYEAIAAVLPDDSLLLTAHHADDQVETFLLQWLRGAGVAGLAAMPFLKPWRKGWLARPLLRWSRTALGDWARRQAIEWIEDPSNLETDIRRNFLRHRVVPELYSQWPGLLQTCARSSAHCAEAAALLEELAAIDRQHCVQGWKLSLDALESLGYARRKNLLRQWPQWMGLPRPGHHLLERILREMLPAAKSAQPLLEWGGAQMRRYRRHLYLMPQLAPAPAAGSKLEWDLRHELALPSGLGELICRSRPQGWPQQVQVHFRPAGLKCAMPGRQGRKSLKAWGQELGIPPWLRARLPVLTDGDRVLAIADYGLCTAQRADNPIQWNRPDWLC